MGSVVFLLLLASRCTSLGMGVSLSAPQYYAVTHGVPDDAESTPAYRAATHPDILVEDLTTVKPQNCWDLFQIGLQLKGFGNCLGSRDVSSDGTLGEYSWRSYYDVEKMAIECGSGLLHLGLVPVVRNPKELVVCARELRLIAVYTKNREEWFLLEQAANAYNLTLVPLYDTLGQKALHYVLTETELTTCVCQGSVVSSLLEISGETKLQHIIVLDPDELTDSIKEQMAEMNIKYNTWSSVLEVGKANIRAVTPAELSNVNTVCYTSGTTGNPKGVLISHRQFVSVSCAVKRGPISTTKGLVLTKDDCHMSYLPLAHVFERMVCQAVFTTGASIGIYGGDTLKLLDDIKVLRPTIFISVPRLFNRINDKVFGTIADRSSVAQRLFSSGLNTKIANLRRNGKPTHFFWDALVFNKTRNLMGGRLRYMIVGGAPLAPVVQERMASLFCCPLIEGYGMTETTGASFFQHAADPVTGSVGGVVPAIEFKLVSRSEMGYCTTDDPPRGELCMRGPGVTEGYFRQPTLTKEAIDSRGWLRTGDVCVLLPNGAIKIIDRAKSMFKLSQGEYVAPEKIEQVYQLCFSIAQVYCSGDTTKSFLVGIVVPESDFVEKWISKNRHSGMTFKEVCSDPEFHAVVEAEMEVIAKAEGLKGFEKIRHFKLHSELFSVENDLLTPTFKLKRAEADKSFASDVEFLYEGSGQD